MSFRSILAGAILAAGAVLGLAPRAQAQTPVMEYKTQGGFVRFNTSMKVYATGFVVCTEQFMNGETLLFTGRLTRPELRALRAKKPSNFSRLPATVYFSSPIADIPARIVRVGKKTVTWVGAQGRPVADANFQAFVSALSDTFYAVAQQEAYHFSRSGGFAFQSTEFSVKNDGTAHLTTSGFIGALDKDGWLAPADMNAIARLFARRDRHGNIWQRMPDFLQSGADLISTTISGNGHTVTSNDPQSEWATFKLIQAALEAAINTVKTQ